MQVPGKIGREVYPSVIKNKMCPQSSKVVQNIGVYKNNLGVVNFCLRSDGLKL